MSMLAQQKQRWDGLLDIIVQLRQSWLWKLYVIALNMNLDTWPSTCSVRSRWAAARAFECRPPDHQIWVGMQEHTERTHEDEGIQTQKITCCAAFEEDCSPAGSPQPLLSKPREKQLFWAGHLFLGSLCCSACEICKKRPLCNLKTASNVDTVVAAVVKIWQGLADSDQIFIILYFHPHWRSVPKPKF